MLLVAPTNVSAVEYGGVGGAPAHPQASNPRTKSIFIYTLKPGQSTTDGIKLYNNTEKQRTIAVYAVDSILASGGAFSCAQAADPKLDVGSWLQLDSTQVTLEPGANKIVPFTVMTPSTASAGEHDGCIAIQDASMTETPSSQNGVTLGFRSAIRVVVTIPGKIVKQLSLTSVNVAGQKDGGYKVTSVARNNGNVSLDTNVQVKLVGLFGNTVAQNEGTYPILARSSAQWSFDFKNPSWGGWYHATTTATYNSDPASGLGESKGGKRAVELNSAVVFVAPSGIPAIIELAILLLLIFALVIAVIKWRQNRDVKHHWRDYTVKDHETLNHIAHAHNVSWKSVAKANKLKPPYHLEKGQKLRLPPKSEK